MTTHDMRNPRRYPGLKLAIIIGFAAVMLQYRGRFGGGEDYWMTAGSACVSCASAMIVAVLLQKSPVAACACSSTFAVLINCWVWGPSVIEALLAPFIAGVIGALVVRERPPVQFTTEVPEIPEENP